VFDINNIPSRENFGAYATAERLRVCMAKQMTLKVTIALEGLGAVFARQYG
jgi:hypothetical protein